MSAWDNFENWAEGVFNQLTGLGGQQQQQQEPAEQNFVQSKYGQGYIVVKDSKGNDVHAPRAGYDQKFRAKAQKSWARENEEHHKRTGEYFKEIKNPADFLGGKYTGVNTHREEFRGRALELVQQKGAFRTLQRGEQQKIIGAIRSKGSNEFMPYVEKYLSKDEVDKLWSMEHLKYNTYVTNGPGFWHSTQ